jgi:hypothetical protein
MSQGARLVVRARYACLDTFTTLDVCIQQRLAVIFTTSSDLDDTRGHNRVLPAAEQGLDELVQN